MSNHISMILLVLLSISYLAINPDTAKAGVIFEEDGIIDACVSNRSGYTRILDPFSRSTRCHFWENPVSWNQNGGGNGDGIMVVTDSTDYTGFCSSISTNDVPLEINCPEGKILIGGDCESDIPMQDTDIGLISLTNSPPTTLLITLVPFREHLRDIGVFSNVKLVQAMVWTAHSQELLYASALHYHRVDQLIEINMCQLMLFPIMLRGKL